METLDKKKLKAVNALIAINGLMDGKKELIMQFTGGRTDRSSYLTDVEANELIAALHKGIKPQPEELRKDKMARHIIAMAHEIGWIPERAMVKNGRMVLVNDYSVLNKWMLEKGYLKKPLNKYLYNELPKLVTQFSEVYKYYINKQSNERK